MASAAAAAAGATASGDCRAPAPLHRCTPSLGQPYSGAGGVREARKGPRVERVALEAHELPCGACTCYTVQLGDRALSSGLGPRGAG